MWPFWQLIKSMRRNDIANKKTKHWEPSCDLVTLWHRWLILTSWETLVMTLRVTDSQRVTWVSFAILAMFNRHLWNVTLTVSKVKGQNLWKVVFVKVNALNEISYILLPDIIPPLEVGVVLNLQPSRSRPHMCLHLSPRCAYHRSVGVGDRVTLYLAPGKWSRPRENPRSGVNKEAEHVEEAELWSVA